MRLMTLLAAALAAYSRTVLACPVRGPIEDLFGPRQKGPTILKQPAGAGAASAYFGRTALASGTAFATLSTMMVKSDSIINLAFSVATTAVSGFGHALGVSSVVHGVSAAVGYLDGQGRGPGGTIMWEIRQQSSF